MITNHGQAMFDAEVNKLAAEADIPPSLLEGTTSAEVFEAWTAADRERGRAAQEWAGRMAETMVHALEDGGSPA